jgi:hypothetical protein
MLVASLPLAAGAGDAPYEIDDEHEHGPHFFGEAKDIKSFAPLAGVHIKAAIRGTSRFIVGATDEEGRFRLRGFEKEVDAENVDVSCAKDGYKPVDIVRRRLSTGPDAPVEVECLLEPGGRTE